MQRSSALAFAKFMSQLTAEVLEVPGVSDEEKFTALKRRITSTPSFTIRTKVKH